MNQAASDISYLINHGYDLKKSTEFCGNHFLLSLRQRMAIARCSASDHALSLRKAKELSCKEIKGSHLAVDGFNQIITMEIFLSKGTLLKGKDGCIRDLAGLRGSYHEIGVTDEAIHLLLNKLRELEPASITFLFDKQVSNSGRLKTSVLKAAEDLHMEVEAQTTATCDTDLKKAETVITSDSIILNECTHWFNLLACLIPDEAITWSLHA